MNEETTVVVNSDTLVTVTEKVENAIAILADQLGMASDHFYPIIVQQQLIEGWIYVGICVPLFFIGLVLFAIGLGGKDRGTEDGNWAVFIGLVFYVIAGIVCASNLAQIINPEYYALMEIKSFIK